MKAALPLFALSLSLTTPANAQGQLSEALARASDRLRDCVIYHAIKTDNNIRPLHILISDALGSCEARVIEWKSIKSEIIFQTESDSSGGNDVVGMAVADSEMELWFAGFLTELEEDEEFRKLLAEGRYGNE
jgi:hypothetical protein